MNPNLLTTRWQDSPEHLIRRLQAKKLRRYIRGVVFSFSAHYRELFRRHGLGPDSIRSLEDLERLPFTSKTDLLGAPGQPPRVQDFLLIPSEAALTRRPAIVLKALVQGRGGVEREST